MKPAFWRAAIIGCCSAAFAWPAQATLYTWDFGDLLSGSFVPGGTFARLTANTTNNRDFLFDLQTYDMNALFTNGAFLTALSVSDTNTGKAADPTSVAIAPGTWGVSSVGLKANASGPGGSKVWDFNFTYPTSGSQGGALRLTAFEEVQWNAVFSVDTFFNDPAFAIHVQGLTNPQGGSAWYTSNEVVAPGPPVAVPEPPIHVLLLAGLGLLALTRRRAGRRPA